MADEQGKFDPFKPAPPRIPGVTDAPPPQPEAEAPAEPATPPRPAKFTPRIIVIGAGAAVVLCLILGWLLLRPSRPGETSAPGESEIAATSAAGSNASSATATPISTTTAPEVPPMYPDEVASLAELGKPWASKRFTFLKKLTVGPMPAIVMRLPGGNAKRPDAYWAFALKIPYGKCELGLVPDLEKLRTDHGYRAQHPMVVDPCTNTIYDPLQFGTVSGAWVRGAVVQGPGLRPPLMIKVEIKGDRLLATQIE